MNESSNNSCMKLNQLFSIICTHKAIFSYFRTHDFVSFFNMILCMRKAVKSKLEKITGSEYASTYFYQKIVNI